MKESRQVEYKFTKEDVMEALSLWMKKMNKSMDTSKDMSINTIVSFPKKSNTIVPPTPKSPEQREREKVFAGLRVVVNG